MHRHGYRGRKLGRERDQRRALLKALSSSLILEGSIETTLPKAKEILPYTEKLITKAKVGDLHNRRQVISSTGSVPATNKLFDEIAPRLTKRSSGHLRLVKTSLRKGDGAQMAQVSFVDNLEEKAPSAAGRTRKTKSPKAAAAGADADKKGAKK